uniref:Uncharacterized protein n=1 Tax=Rhodomela confervoides TaxID=35163 RepID=A0A1Z1M9K9_RHOCN|nr:hypothetical protein [Rhodomela confervoides]ARW62666.1 hypothetical protein [Rhodomela confervoides]
MVSNLKNIYHDKYDESNLDHLTDSSEYENDNIEMPTGWSFICLDETINYYADHQNKSDSSSNR